MIAYSTVFPVVCPNLLTACNANVILLVDHAADAIGAIVGSIRYYVGLGSVHDLRSRIVHALELIAHARYLLLLLD